MYSCVSSQSVTFDCFSTHRDELYISRSRMASLGLHLLTVFLGALFIFLGHVKLTPQFFPEYHAQVKNEFGKFNKEFPFHRQTGWRPYAKNYRLAVGITEMTCGFLLLLGNDGFQTFSRAMSVLLFSLSRLFPDIGEHRSRRHHDQCDHDVSKVELWPRICRHGDFDCFHPGLTPGVRVQSHWRSHRAKTETKGRITYAASKRSSCTRFSSCPRAELVERCWCARDFYFVD